jgi:hypothetical protein
VTDFLPFHFAGEEPHPSEFAEAIEEAVATLERWCGTSAVEYFESFRERVDGPPDACHAVGIIEGAALALGMTPIELLDDLAMGGGLPGYEAR